MELELSINGVIESLDIAPGESLLTLLRREGYSEIKRGCGTGECGACTVLVDGVARPSCVMLAAQAGGGTLTTVDGLAPARQLHPLQQAFVEFGAVQCGFCTPGMLLSAAAFLQQNPDPTEGEVRDVLSGNLCHCTGYEKPVQAVLHAAAVMRDEAKSPLEYSSGDTGKQPVARVRTERGSTAHIPTVSALASTLPVNGQLRVVGQSLPVIDAAKLVRGKAAFADDITLRGMLYGRVLTSPHAHAVIRDSDVAQAKALPGVHAIVTYKDVARVAYASSERPAEGPRDQYSLDYRVRYVGDRVAIVAAETPEIAEQALRLIQVDYTALPAILDPRQALEADTPALHPEVESRGIYDARRNIAARLRSETGDLDTGFAAADLVVENEYVVSQQQPLVRQSVVTYFDEDGYLVVRTGTQIPNYIRSTLASILNLPARRIRVVKTHAEGDAGASQELVLEDLCALLTLATNRPVMMSEAGADEPLRVAQQSVLRVKTGVKRDGTLVANQMILLTSTGASATHPLIDRSAASFGALALYPCPHMRFAAEVLYTTMPPARAGYAASAQQEFFALESHMDEVARQLGMDALELRRKNLPENASQTTSASSAALTSCLQIVEEKLRWREMRGRVSNGHVRRGVGIALSLREDSADDKSTSGAIIKLNGDGSFDVFASVGSGVASTLVAQVAAEVLGVTVDDILLHTSDTSLLPFETGSGASIYNNAVQKAAEQVRRQILSMAGRLLGALPETLRIDSGVITTPKGQSVTVAQVAEQALYVEGRQIMTTASVKGQHEPLSCAAHGVEVEVDTETGEVRVLKVFSAVDAGRVLNPLLVEGQVQGDAALGLSAALSEERLYDVQGAPLPTGDYRVLNSSDMPLLQTYLVETDTSSSLFGAKPAVPTFGIAPALANAVADALGTRIRQLPLTPERVLRAVYAQTAKK
jgi:putative selenate reductase molybdopterin-binding subunit